MMAIILAAVAWLATYLLHSTVLIAGALGLAALGVVRSAAARDTLWKVALVGGLVTATAQLVLSLQPRAGHVAIAARPESPFVEVAGVREAARPSLPAADPAYPAAEQFSGALAAAPSAGEDPGPAPRTVVSLFDNVHIGWPALLLNLWLVGAFGLALRLGWARLALSRGLRGRRAIASGPLRDTLDELAAQAGVSAPALSVSDVVSGPIAFGREIVLPERVLTHLAGAEQRAVIAHELGHVVRRDPAWLLAALVIESVLFVQPLNGVVRRRLRAVSEFVCDDWAAERTDGLVLAACLAEVAAWVRRCPAPAAAVGMAGHCSQLVSRVERLVAGARPQRTWRWTARAAAAVLALGMVAWSVPGVAAEDLGLKAAAAGDGGTSGPPVPVRLAAAGRDDTWGSVQDDGRLVVLEPGFSVRLRGQGRLGFRQWGRAIAVSDGYEIRVDDERVDDGRELCGSSSVTLVETDGAGRWELTPVRQAGAPAYAAGDDQHSRDRALRQLDRAGRQSDLGILTDAGSELTHNVSVLTRTSVRLALAGALGDKDGTGAESDAATDTALGGSADAAIDTLVQLWVRDPEAVRRAARRIARTYDRDLRPQFESLGVEMGRQLAPRLQRLTDRVGRDLAPEFARLGAELGASIVGSIADPAPAGTAGGKRQPKAPRH